MEFLCACACVRKVLQRLGNWCEKGGVGGEEGPYMMWRRESGMSEVG